jgi:putative restriction endonuclease
MDVRTARPTKKPPMLEGLKKLEGVNLHLPPRAKDYPNRERLSLRFERFRAAY